MQVAARRGHADARAELVGPEYPRRYQYLIDWFYELHRRRGSGPMGPAGFTWPDFDAWARRTGREPSPWEFDVLSAMDDAFFRVTAKPSAPPSR